MAFWSKIIAKLAAGTEDAGVGLGGVALRTAADGGELLGGDGAGRALVAVGSSVLPPDAAKETTLLAAEAHLGNIDTSTAASAGGIGTAADAKVDTDAVGTVSAKLRGIVSRLIDGTAIVNARTAIGVWLPATAAAPADSGVIRAAACKVGRVFAVNSHATITYYLMLFDLAAVPANGTAPRYPSIPLPPGQTVVIDLGGTSHATGLCWSDSTTIATKTIAATTPFQVSAEVL